MAHQGRYPVIHLSLKDVRYATITDTLQAFELLMRELYEHFDYLLTSPQLSSSARARFESMMNGHASSVMLTRSLYMLIEFLHRHHGVKPMVLIDEYDTPVHEAYACAEPYHDALIHFYKNWLGSAFKDNPHLEKGLLTGILRVALMNLFSGVNSIPAYTVLRAQYAPYFGFTQDEVDQLLEESNLIAQQDAVKHWYNGYEIAGVTLYNPWSVLSCIAHHGSMEPYWSGSGDHGILAKAMLECQDGQVLEGLEALLLGKTWSVTLDEMTLFSGLGHAASIWGLMLYAGYLKALPQEEHDGQVCVALPNQEVRVDIQGIVRQWVSYGSYPKTRALAYQEEPTLMDSFCLALRHGQVDHLEAVLQSFLEEAASYHDFPTYSDERCYHIFLLGMMVLLQDRYVIQSNKEMGLGRFDIALAPKGQTPGRGILIELKRARHPDALGHAASAALTQMTDKRYDAFFRVHPVTDVLHLGLAFYGKQVTPSHAWLNGNDSWGS